MFQTVKAIAISGMIATGLPLLTKPANALTPWNYYLIRPVYCDTFQSGDILLQGAQTYLNIYDGNNGVYISVRDNLAISSLIKMCYDGAAFYGLYLGPNNDAYAQWGDFFFYPGLR